MFLLTQDKHDLLQFSRVTISRNIGGKRDAKFALCAYVIGSDSSLNYVTIGLYADEDAAAAELARITEALHTGKTVYEVQ